MLIDGVSHGYGSGWLHSIRRVYTRCRIPYTHKADLADAETRLASRTTREIDCMACIAARCGP